MKKELNEMEEILRLMRERFAEVEGLKHIITGGATTISERAHEKVQGMIEEAFNPLKPIKLSKEAYKKIEEADNEPISEEAKKAIDEFIKEPFGTDYEKKNTKAIKTREEIESKLSELEIVAKYIRPDEQERILGWINALRWVLNRTCIISIMDNR